MAETEEAIDKSVAAAALGFPLRDKQRETLRAVLQGQDVLAVLPTAYGKTLTFALLPAAWDALTSSNTGSSIVVVISPLVALMEEQVVRINTLGVPAAYLGSTDNTPDTLQKVRDGKFPIVMLSPEAVFTEKWRDILDSPTYKSRVKTIVVDESHVCVVWGAEFRKDYGRLGELRSLLPDANMLALTASAPPSMRHNMYEALAMRPNQVRVIELSTDRPNIFYSAVTGTTTIDASLYWLAEELLEKKLSCPKYIIYCRSVKDCAVLYDYFEQKLEDEAYVGVPSFRRRLFGMFHRPTIHCIKKFIVDKFSKIDSPVRVVICTIAFGMGIDVPDVKGIIHWGASKSFEGFYQESGRAGRDGEKIPQAFSIVYYRATNISSTACGSDMRSYCVNDDSLCRRSIISKHFCPKLPDPVLNKKHNCCDVCQKKCLCGNCPQHIPSQLQVTDSELAISPILNRFSALGRDVSSHQKVQLKAALLEFIDTYDLDCSLLSGSLRTGLDATKIHEIVHGVAHIHSVDDLMTEYLYDVGIASAVMNQISSIFNE